MSKLFDITCILDRECQYSGQLDLTLSGFEITLYTNVETETIRNHLRVTYTAICISDDNLCHDCYHLFSDIFLVQQTHHFE